MRIRCGIWCRRLLLACCAGSFHYCAMCLPLVLLQVSVSIPFCRPCADAGGRQGRTLSMKAVQDPSACWLTMATDAIRIKPVLACCGPLPLFQYSRPGHLLCGTSKAADPADAEETWSRPMPSKRMQAFIALTVPLKVHKNLN